MNRYILGVSFAACVGLAFAAGCSSSSSPGGGGGSGGSSGGDFNCDYKSNGVEECYSYSGLTSDETTAVTAGCSEPGATTPSSCPTANKSGCCEDIAYAGLSGVTYGYCVYSVPSADIATQMTVCTGQKGKWSTM
jgi:hypothetical protein